jgi:hypothetical protein
MVARSPENLLRREEGVSARTRDEGFMVFTLGCEYIVTKETPPSQLAPPAWRGPLKGQRGLGFGVFSMAAGPRRRS